MHNFSLEMIFRAMRIIFSHNLSQNREINLGEENDGGKFEVFGKKFISMLKNWYSQNPQP